MRLYVIVLLSIHMLWILDATSDTPAYILNDNSQLVTSTSLKWVRSSGGQRPLNSVIAGSFNDSSIFACRYFLGGSRYKAGVLTWEACIGIGDPNSQISFKEDYYEVLVNSDGAARLEWANWTRHKESRMPIGAVSISGKELFAARSHDLEFGTLYFRDILGVASYIQTAQYSFLQIGQVLVEHEPIYFELQNFRKGLTRSVHRDHAVLPVPIYVHVKSQSESRTSVWDYESPNYVYFGSSGHGIPRGVPVKIFLEDNQSHLFSWGSQLNLTKQHKLRLSYRLPLNTQVRVDVKATKLVKKYDFSATIVAHFRDGAIMMRGIKGVYKHVRYVHFRPIFGQPQVLKKTVSPEPNGVADDAFPDKVLNTESRLPPPNTHRLTNETVQKSIVLFNYEAEKSPPSNGGSLLTLSFFQYFEYIFFSYVSLTNVFIQKVF